MEEPPVYMIVMEYLGQLCRDSYSGSWDEVGKTLGISKQQVYRLRDGGSVGLDLLLRLADKLERGSVDALIAQSRRWYNNLPDKRREEVRQHAIASHEKRIRTPVRSDEELASIRSGTTPGTAKSAKKRHSRA